MLKLGIRLLERLFVADKWNIGFINQSITSLIQQKCLNPIVWLIEDKVDYAADPFVVTVNDQVKVYYEELNFWCGRGKIMVIEDFDFKTKKVVSGISPSSIHLSYPYLFKKGQELYCIPETSSAKEVALYKVNARKPSILRKDKVLLSGMEFVDSSIIFYVNKYWLFTSVSGHHNQLYIFHSLALNGDYQAHQLNPIKVETQACRGAGSLFIVDGLIYRPTQNPTNCYGGAIQISKINVLTEDRYEAEPVFDILPDEPYSKGIHHISFNENQIVVDGKREVVELMMPIKKLVKKIYS